MHGMMERPVFFRKIVGQGPGTRAALGYMYLQWRLVPYEPLSENKTKQNKAKMKNLSSLGIHGA